MALDNAEDYPNYQNLTSQKLRFWCFSRCAKQYLVCNKLNDSLRPVMTEFFSSLQKKETNFVSTDSHRLVVYKRTDITNKETVEFIMPKPLSIFKNILSNSNDKVTIEFNENMAKFTFGENIWICRLIDLKISNYSAVILRKSNVLTVNRNFIAKFYQKSKYFIKQIYQQS